MQVKPLADRVLVMPIEEQVKALGEVALVLAGVRHHEMSQLFQIVEAHHSLRLSGRVEGLAQRRYGVFKDKRRRPGRARTEREVRA